MDLRLLLMIPLVASLASCDKRPEVVVEETRRVIERDRSPKLHATSDERFRDMKPEAAMPSPLEAVTPDGWVSKPATTFRALNYGFGSSGAGECWVSMASGSVFDNVNRWLGQFATAPVDEQGFASLRRVPIVGVEGVWVEAVGTYAGMGGAVSDGFALAGVIAEVNGRLLTVKMVGPKDEVELAKPQLESLIASLKLKP